MHTVHLSLRWFELARGWRIGRGQNGPRVIDALAAPRSDVTASNSTQQEPGELARFCFWGVLGLWHSFASLRMTKIVSKNLADFFARTAYTSDTISRK